VGLVCDISVVEIVTFHQLSQVDFKSIQLLWENMWEFFSSYILISRLIFAQATFAFWSKYIDFFE
jgi:hypothetical protein